MIQLVIRHGPLHIVGVTLLVAFLMQACTEPAWAQRDTTEHDHWKLVRKLASPEYAVRQGTERELLRLGIRVRPALTRALKDADLELRLAAYHVLLKIDQEQFDQLTESFLETGKSALHLPGWKSFQSQVGNTPTSRQLFLQMLRTEPKLLETLDANPGKATWQYASRLEQLTTSRIFGGASNSVTRGTLATLLFVDTQLQLQLKPNALKTFSSVNGRMASLLQMPQTAPLITQGKSFREVRQLLVTWLKCEVDRGSAWTPLQLAMKYDFRESGLEMARKVLEETGTAGSSIPYGAIALARFGTRRDAERLLKHLDNENVFHTWTNPAIKNGPVKIEVRDVVLVMLLRMLDQEPKDFGFALLEPYSETFYRIWTFGFVEDGQRAAAFTKWETWFEAHKGELALKEPTNVPGPIKGSK